MHLSDSICRTASYYPIRAEQSSDLFELLLRVTENFNFATDFLKKHAVPLSIRLNEQQIVDNAFL